MKRKDAAREKKIMDWTNNRTRSSNSWCGSVDS